MYAYNFKLKGLNIVMTIQYNDPEFWQSTCQLVDLETNSFRLFLETEEFYCF